MESYKQYPLFEENFSNDFFQHSSFHKKKKGKLTDDSDGNLNTHKA